MSDEIEEEDIKIEREKEDKELAQTDISKDTRKDEDLKDEIFSNVISNKPTALERTSNKESLYDREKNTNDLCVVDTISNKGALHKRIGNDSYDRRFSEIELYSSENCSIIF